MEQEQAPSSATKEELGEDTPELLPEQLRPDEKGRCPGKGMISLHGGCWNETSWGAEKCEELGGQMLKGTCYLPVILPGRKRPPTSSPMKDP